MMDILAETITTTSPDTGDQSTFGLGIAIVVILAITIACAIAGDLE